LEETLKKILAANLSPFLKNNMEQTSERASSSIASNLFRNIKKFRTITDPAYNHLTKDQLLSDENEISLVSEKYRREVYTIKSDLGIFYLKFSSLVRKKDQLRFLLLPWRIFTEWRNLARLSRKGINAAQRVLFGYDGLYPNHGFFLITKAIEGSPTDLREPDQIHKLAVYMASLHAAGVFHRDIHPENILMDHEGKHVLLDAQEIYILPWMPRRLKIANLGNMLWHLLAHSQDMANLDDFLAAYNSGTKSALLTNELIKAINRRRQRHYRSRSKRCFKNSTEFQIIKNAQGLKGFKRRDFSWDKPALQNALAHGTPIKGEKLIAYKDVCIKIHNRRLFHKNRSRISWKMARALSVRGINVPHALSYLTMGNTACFLTTFYSESLTLNDYFSSGIKNKRKNEALKQFADWLRTCHDLNVWQRDFKSSNVLAHGNQFMMVDLDGVRICRKLPWRKKLMNLAQLNASISNHITLKDRLRFFKYYCQGELLPRRTRRRAYQKIWQISQKKNTLPFGLDLEKLRSEIP